jgi:hypothetical protein
VCLDELSGSDGRSRVKLTPGNTLRFGSLGCVYTGPVESVAGRTFGRPPHPNVLSGAAACEVFVRSYSGDVIIGMLGPSPTQERFRLVAYYRTDLAFQASRDRPLGWGGFVERYSAMYPHGQPGLPDDPVMAYVDSLRATSIVPGSATTQSTPTAQHHDPTRECNVCVAPASSSSESEHAPHHRGANAQRQARLDELAEARRKLDDELVLFHQELDTDAEPRDRQPAQSVPVQGNGDRRLAWDVPVQGEPDNVNDNRREHCPSASQSHGRASTPPARALEPNNDQLANEGANVNASADAPPLFRRASQTCPPWPCCCAATRNQQLRRSDEYASS